MVDKLDYRPTDFAIPLIGYLHYIWRSWETDDRQFIDRDRYAKYRERINTIAIHNSICGATVATVINSHGTEIARGIEKFLSN